MHLLLVSATDLEINSFSAFLSSNSPKTGAPGQFQIGKATIRLLITGPGINQSAFHLGSHLVTHRYDLCIQAGIAGAFNRSIQMGETVQVVTEQFAQAGAEDDEQFTSLFELGLMEKNKFPYTDGKLINPYQHSIKTTEHLKFVDAITVETVHGNEASIHKTIQKYNPSIETMEGAPFFYACLFNKIPFMQLRSISNYVEKRNKANWNIPLAVENLNRLLIQLTEEISA